MVTGGVRNSEPLFRRVNTLVVSGRPAIAFLFTSGVRRTEGGYDMLNAKHLVIGFAAVALATASAGMAKGDIVRDRLHDGSCLIAGDQIRDRIQDCDEICVPIGDGIPDQLRIHLHDTV